MSQVREYAIIALDPQGVIESWNVGAELLKGYTAQEAIGSHFTMFYTPEDRRAGVPLKLLDEARSAGYVNRSGWRVRKDGTRYRGDTSISATRDGAGNLTGFVKVTRDVTDHYAAQVALRESEERFRLLVSQVVDYSIISLDPQGVIESWNAGAELLKGYTAQEAIGSHFTMFYTPEDRRAGVPLRLLDEARMAGHVEHTGWRVRKDGTRFWGDVVITALRDPEGTLTGYAKVTRDRTETRRLQEMRDALFSGITHDLRTPIIAIRGFVTLLTDEDDPEARDELVGRIAANTETLSDLVDQLVAYVRLRSGQLVLDTQPLDVVTVAREVVSSLGPVLQGRSVELPDGSCVVDADRGALVRVLTNIVSNAARYSPDGSRVRIEVSRRDHAVQVEVRDEGRGIAEQDLDSVFDEFERGTLSTDAHGMGLGLSIVRQLVELHGGQVWIDSALGEGTTVGFQLPAPAHTTEPART